MIPRLVPEISPLDAFCDVVVAGVTGVVVGIGDSRSCIPSFPALKCNMHFRKKSES